MPGNAIPENVQDKLSLAEEVDPKSPPSLLDYADKHDETERLASVFNMGDAKSILHTDNQPFIKPLPPLTPLLDFTQFGGSRVQSAPEGLKAEIFSRKEALLQQIQQFVATKRDEFEEYLQHLSAEFHEIAKAESTVVAAAAATSFATPIPSRTIYKHGRTLSGKHVYFSESPPRGRQNVQPADEDPEMGFEDVIGPTDVDDVHESEEAESAAPDALPAIGKPSNQKENPLLTLNGLSIQGSRAAGLRNTESLSYLSSSKPVDIRPNPTLIEGDGGRPARTESERRLENETLLSYSEMRDLRKTDPANMSFSQRMEWEQLKDKRASQSVYD